MVTMETKSQNPMTNSIQPNLISNGQNALGPGEFTEFRCGLKMDGNNWKAQVQRDGECGSGCRSSEFR
ncbi:hypothetical protein EJD97_008981 [Solanum chilense]|uniref:Uncharacterized protein n=1 Tax=Solanum chilense TaxID=4083 RepID=A0A6N2BL46_SOLCI|nr:hypothetical protein EJD97_008981 [Solanum chilense]